MEIKLGLTTCPDNATAERIAGELLKHRLAACASILPGMVSLYEWKGELCRDPEVLLLLKTTGDAWQRMEQKIVELHPYELPEIIAVPVERGLAGYLDWVASQVDEKK